MAGDLVIEEGDLEVLRDRTSEASSGLRSVTVATAGDFLSSALGGASSRGWDAAPARRSMVLLPACPVTWMIFRSPSMIRSTRMPRPRMMRQ